MTPTRRLGRDGPTISAIGLGCFAIGGVALRDGAAHGWTGVDDAASTRAIHAALDMGGNFFDTADAYGCGRSERVLGAALAGRPRDSFVVATKFCKLFDEATGVRQSDGLSDVSGPYVRGAIVASLRRLRLDHVDLYQLHDGKLDLAAVPDLLGVLDDLVAQGLIGGYGWSTDDAARAEAFAAGAHCRAVQLRLNVVERDAPALAVCEAQRLAALCRCPLGQGLLTGRMSADTVFDAGDLRAKWTLGAGEKARQLAQLDALRALLTTGGRTLAQGALGWLLAVSPATVPIPGFKSVAQVRDNLGALEKGPLPAAVMAEVEAMLRAESAA